MHKWVYEKTECLKNEICSKGFDNLTRENLEEAYYISKILKNIVCIDKDYHIVDAMEKAENEENMEAVMEYTDYPNKKRHMSVGMYRNEDYDHMGKMDKMAGRKFYTETHERSEHEGKSGISRAKYMMTKDTNDMNSKMKNIEEYVNDLSYDMMNLTSGMPAELKSMMKTKFQQIVSKI